jgi:hypothetical protein
MVPPHSITGGHIIGGAAPLKNTDNATVEQGLAAWKRRKAEVRASWEDWKLIGAALLVGRRWAMGMAHKDEPEGKAYNQLFGVWVEKHGFGDIDKGDRAKLLLIMGKLDEIEAWRAKKLTEDQRRQYNHPSTIWRVSKCRVRGLNSDQPSATSGDATPRGDEDADDRAEKRWQKAIMVRANQAVGAATIKHWVLDTPPDPGLIAAVREAAEAWTRLAERLESLALSREAA